MMCLYFGYLRFVSFWDSRSSSRATRPTAKTLPLNGRLLLLWLVALVRPLSLSHSIDSAMLLLLLVVLLWVITNHMHLPLSVMHLLLLWMLFLSMTLVWRCSNALERAGSMTVTTTTTAAVPKEQHFYFFSQRIFAFFLSTWFPSHFFVLL